MGDGAVNRLNYKSVTRLLAHGRQVPRFNRRQLLAAIPPLALTMAGVAAGSDRGAAQSSAAKAFGFGDVEQAAKALAEKAYVSPQPPVPDVVNTIDFDFV